MNNFDERPVWGNAEAYENFAGKSSRMLGTAYLKWLDPVPNARWLEVGCGTGAFTSVILNDVAPVEVIGIDPAQAQIEFAGQNIKGANVAFQTGDALDLPFADDEFDYAASGLVLNFVPDQAKMISEMRRVVRPAGRIGLYVWDFDGRGPNAQHIAAAIEARDPEAAETAATGQRFETTHRDYLQNLFQDCGLGDVQTQLLEIDVRFTDFDAYWSANTGFTAPVSQYASGLSAPEREKFIAEVKHLLPISEDGSIAYIAGANAVQGTVPG